MMMFLWLPFLLIIPLAILWMRPGMVGGCGSHSAHMSPVKEPDPIDVARVRLARGEITINEYDAIRRTLGR